MATGRGSRPKRSSVSGWTSPTKPSSTPPDSTLAQRPGWNMGSSAGSKTPATPSCSSAASTAPLGVVEVQDALVHQPRGLPAAPGQHPADRVALFGKLAVPGNEGAAHLEQPEGALAVALVGRQGRQYAAAQAGAQVQAAPSSWGWPAATGGCRTPAMPALRRSSSLIKG